MANGDYLHLVQGDTWTYSTTANYNGVEQNLTGGFVSLYAIANPQYEGGVVLLNVNTDSGQIALSGNNNATITVSLNSVFTQNIPAANVGGWFLRSNVSGNVLTVEKGRIAVVPGLPAIPLP